VTEVNTIVAERKHSVTDIGCIMSSGVVSIVAGDKIWLAIEGITDATDFIIEHSNINVTRI